MSTTTAKKATTTRSRKAADPGVQDLMDLAAGKRKPATVKKAAPTKAAPKATKTEAPVNGQHRKAILEELARLGWDGPTSYTVTSLRDDLLPWVAAGTPADAPNIPAGAMNHAHPKPKAAKAKRISKGYAQALRDLLEQDDPKAWATTLLAEVDA